MLKTALNYMLQKILKILVLVGLLIPSSVSAEFLADPRGTATSTISTPDFLNPNTECGRTFVDVFKMLGNVAQQASPSDVKKIKKDSTMLANEAKRLSKKYNAKKTQIEVVFKKKIKAAKTDEAREALTEQLEKQKNDLQSESEKAITDLLMKSAQKSAIARINEEQKKESTDLNKLANKLKRLPTRPVNLAAELQRGQKNLLAIRALELKSIDGPLKALNGQNTDVPIGENYLNYICGDGLADFQKMVQLMQEIQSAQTNFREALAAAEQNKDIASQFQLKVDWTEQRLQHLNQQLDVMTKFYSGLLK